MSSQMTRVTFRRSLRQNVMTKWIVAVVLAACVGCGSATEGPAGKDGAPGAPGADGVAGPAGKDGRAADAGRAVDAKAPHVVYSAPVAVPVGGTTKASATCPDGETMLSGGCMVGPGGTVIDSHPTPFAASPTYWECSATATATSQLWVYLFCE